MYFHLYGVRSVPGVRASVQCVFTAITERASALSIGVQVQPPCPEKCGVFRTSRWRRTAGSPSCLSLCGRAHSQCSSPPPLSFPLAVCARRIMNKTLKALKRGAKAGVKAASEPISRHHKYSASGHRIHCSQCACEVFEPGPPFSGILSGPVLQCVECSHLEFFGRGDALVEEGS